MTTKIDDILNTLARCITDDVCNKIYAWTDAERMIVWKYFLMGLEPDEIPVIW